MVPVSSWALVKHYLKAVPPPFSLPFLSSASCSTARCMLSARWPSYSQLLVLSPPTQPASSIPHGASPWAGTTACNGLSCFLSKLSPHPSPSITGAPTSLQQHGSQSSSPSLSVSISAASKATAKRSSSSPSSKSSPSSASSSSALSLTLVQAPMAPIWAAAPGPTPAHSTTALKASAPSSSPPPSLSEAPNLLVLPLPRPPIHASPCQRPSNKSSGASASSTSSRSRS